MVSLAVRSFVRSSLNRGAVVCDFYWCCDRVWRLLKRLWIGGVRRRLRGFDRVEVSRRRCCRVWMVEYVRW